MPDGGAGEQGPDASVVIPFGGGDEAMLREQLRAVGASVARAFERDATRVEIVLAVNAPQAEQLEARLLASESGASALGASLRVVDASGERGAGYARNRGVEAARSQRILFCDADDVVDVDWARRLIAGLRSYDIVTGVVDTLTLNPGAAVPVRGVPTSASRPYGWLPCGASANLAARRERFESVGGFDESLRTNEDADLCWRVQYAGGSFGWIEDAVVRYRWRSTLASHARQTYRWGRDTGALVRAHRAHGLRPSISAGLRELVGALVRVPVFVFVPARRWNAAGSIARTWGRTVASVRERVWTLGA